MVGSIEVGRLNEKTQGVMIRQIREVESISPGGRALAYKVCQQGKFKIPCCLFVSLNERPHAIVIEHAERAI